MLGTRVQTQASVASKPRFLFHSLSVEWELGVPIGKRRCSRLVAEQGKPPPQANTVRVAHARQ